MIHCGKSLLDVSVLKNEGFFKMAHNRLDSNNHGRLINLLLAEHFIDEAKRYGTKIDKDDIDQVKKKLADECEVLKKQIARGDLTAITVQLLYNQATRKHKYTFNLALTP